MKKSVFLILFFCVLTGLAFFLKPEDPGASGKIEADYLYEVEGAWNYPVLPGTQEWENLNFQERKESCQIPREELDNMTTEALLETALNYPYNANLYAYDDEANGFYALLQWNDALAALRERSGRHEAVRVRLEDMDTWMDKAGETASALSRSQYSYLTAFAAYME